jgi:hypothetical protein
MIESGLCCPAGLCSQPDENQGPSPCYNSIEGGINAGTGNNYQDFTDLSLSSPGISMDFRRSYNSQSSYGGPLGYGWTHSFDMSLEVRNEKRIIRDSTGKPLYFHQTWAWQPPQGEVPFAGESGVKDKLSQVILTGEYLLRRKDSNLT